VFTEPLPRNISGIFGYLEVVAWQWLYTLQYVLWNFNNTGFVCPRIRQVSSFTEVNTIDIWSFYCQTESCVA
jgi:hypothetical protein